MSSTKYEIEKFTGVNDFGLWHLKMLALLVQQDLLEALKGSDNMERGRHIGYLEEFGKEFAKEFGKEYAKESYSKKFEKTKRNLQHERNKSYWLTVALIVSCVLFAIVFNMM
ncbi:unnamed protein product [Lathyrus sativus]|nr:unnamed protein product [Lathyrus sativus]